MKKTMQHFTYWIVFFIALTGAIYTAYSGYKTAQINQLISQLNQGRDIEPKQMKNATPELQLARAIYLKNKKRYKEAQATLSLIINQGTQQLQAISRYNLGNTYLIQAIEFAEALQINEASALAALAKQAYRQALALDSHYWDAKYNLEVAVRLLPEMDRITMERDDPVPQEKAKLWATVPGFPRGLP